MIINPIIPIWLMSIICVILIILIIYNKPLKEKIVKNQNGERNERQRKLIKSHIIDSFVKIGIIIFIFIINLRFMIPNGENTVINSDLRVLFVIDKSASMKALDYEGNKERLEGVINDCCYIVDELASARFSIITFGDIAQKIVPFTTDSDIVQAELKAINTEDVTYANGTSLNIVKDILEKTLKDENEKQEKTGKVVVFFISDGEITVDGEKLESFSNIKKYISEGAIMGYGTSEGGKMKDPFYTPDGILGEEYAYLYNYDDNGMVTILSKIDENNLKQLAGDLGVDYIQMSKTSNIDYKISDIKRQMTDSASSEQKIASYADIYYYFAIPLVILLIVHFIIQKRRM